MKQLLSACLPQIAKSRKTPEYTCIRCCSLGGNSCINTDAKYWGVTGFTRHSKASKRFNSMRFRSSRVNLPFAS